MTHKLTVQQLDVKVTVTEQAPINLILEPQTTKLSVVESAPIEVYLEETQETITVEQVVFRLTVEENPIVLQLNEAPQINLVLSPSHVEYRITEEVIRIVLGTPSNPITIANYFVERSVLVYGPTGRIQKFGMYAQVLNLQPDGTIQFHPTTNGLMSGIPIFESITIVSAQVFKDDVPLHNRPFVDGYAIIGNHTVELNVVKGKKQVMLVGDVVESFERASDTSIQVHCLIGGQLKSPYYNVSGSANIDAIETRLAELEERVNALEPQPSTSDILTGEDGFTLVGEDDFVMIGET